MASIAVRYNEFQKLNAEVLAVSSDSVYVHKVWNDSELSKMVNGGIPYPMLADVTGSISKSYEVYEESKGITLRSTFIIDPEGYVQGTETLSSNTGRSTSEILRQLQAFQNFKENGTLTPADWNPGDKVLTDSIELAGNIWREWKPKSYQ